MQIVAIDQGGDLNAHHYQRLEALLNRALAGDPVTLAALAPFSGKVLALEFVRSGLHVFLLPGAAGIGVRGAIDGEPNVRIRGSVADMFAYLMATRTENDSFSGSLEIIGDIALAQRFQSAMKGFEFDWEEQLSTVTGDVLARRLGNLLRGGAQFIRASGRTLGLDVSEYLRYEKEWLPDRGEVEEYTDRVQALHRDAESLRQRIERLRRAG